MAHRFEARQPHDHHGYTRWRASCLQPASNTYATILFASMDWPIHKTIFWLERALNTARSSVDGLACRRLVVKVLGVTVVAVLGYKCVNICYKLTRKAPFPGPAVTSVIGMLFMSPEKQVELFTSFADKFGKICSLQLFTETIVLVSDMELYRDIAKRRPREFSRLDFPNVSGEDALPYLEGDTWKKKRRIVARPLTDKNVESFLPMICSVARSLVEHVRCRGDCDGTVARWEPEEDLRLCASKVAAALCMGDADPLAWESPLYHDDFLNNAVQLTTQELEIGLHPMDVPILRNPLLRLFSPTLKKFWKDSKRLMASLRDIMASRTGIDKAGRFPSIVDNAGEDPSLHGSAIILKTFIAAGTETTAHFTAKLLKRLCLNPRAQERARDEVLKLEHDPESYEELRQLPFLHACILETLRLDQLGPVLPIRALTNCVLAGKPIAAGTRVLIMHKKILERSCDRGTEFRPVRWLTPDETDIDQAKWSKFVAFGYGPRQCPGKHLAMKEMIVFAAYLLRYFDNIRLGEGCKIEDKYTTFLGMHQKDFYVAMDAGRKAAMWGTDPGKPF